VVERVGSEPSRFRAVEPDELAARVGQEFAERLESARRELRAIPVRAPARVAGGSDAEAAGETITDWRRLRACWRQGLDSAGREVLAAIGPWVRELYPRLEDLARRGVAARVLALGSPAPRGAVLRAVPAAELVEYWGGLPFAAVVDRRTAVFGIVGAGGSPVAQLSQSPAAVPFVRHVLRRELTAPLGLAAHAPGPEAGRGPGARGSA
jgi:sugar-specific transcriptional regulator TrmB